MRVDDGLLVWDGTVLELFPTDGRSDAWRIHGATVEACEFEQRRGGSLLKIPLTKRYYRSVFVPDALLAEVRAIVTELEAAS